MFTSFEHFTLRSTSLRSRSCKIRSKKKKRKKEEEEEKSMETTKNSKHYTAASLNFLERKYFHLILCIGCRFKLTSLIIFKASYDFGPQYLSLSDLITIVKVITVINIIFSLSLFFVSFCCCCWLFVLIFCILSFEASQVLKKVTNQVT